MAIRTSKLMGLPHFNLTKADEFLANKARTADHAGSIVQPILVRFPFIPEFHVYHPAMAYNALLMRWRKDPSVLFMLDERFHEIVRDKSHAKIVKKYVEHWHEDERIQREKFDESWRGNELMRRLCFFHRAREIMLKQVDKRKRAEALVDEYIQLINEVGKRRGEKWVKETRQKMLDAAANRQRWLEFHQDYLFTFGPNGGIIRLPKRGEPVEKIFGEVRKELAEKQVKDDRKWRADQHFATRLNGAVIRMHNGVGEMRAVVEAKQQDHILKRRTEAFDFWHDLNFLVPNNNGTLRHQANTGAMPEKAQAQLAIPHQDRQLKEFKLFHKSGNLLHLPNDALVPMPDAGKPTEIAHAERYWPDRHKISDRFQYWHETHRFVATVNGTVAPDITHGKSLEKAGFDANKPIAEKRVKDALYWHASHKFGPTPNGGFAPLLNVGHSIEKASADHDKPIKENQVYLFKDKFLKHRFVQTVNHLLAPMKSIGQKYETVSADIYGDHQDVMTRHFFKMRRERQLRHDQLVGKEKTLEANLHGREKAQDQLNLTRGNTAPMPSVGKAAQETPLELQEQRDAKTRRLMRDLQKALAAHEPTVSRLTDHAVADRANVVKPPIIKKLG